MFNMIKKETCFSARLLIQNDVISKDKMYLTLAGCGMPNGYHFNITAAAMEMLEENLRFGLRNKCTIYRRPHSFGGLLIPDIWQNSFLVSS